MARYINADKLYPDKFTVGGSLAISQSQIAEQPTADVRENVHGEWVLEHSSQLWECTNCHEREIRTTDFCPNCGADMRGEEHE